MTAANPRGCVTGELLEGRLPRHAASFENRGPGFRIAQSCRTTQARVRHIQVKTISASIVPEVPKTASKKKCFGPFSHSCDKEYSSNCQLTSYIEHLMSDDYVFLAYQAKITNAGHAEYEGEAVHCMIKVKSVDEHGKRRRNVELEQQARDNVLFVINPGPINLGPSLFGVGNC